MQPETGVDPYEFATNARTILLEDRSRWRSFGVYWPLVKALLRKRFSDAELPLGDYVDQELVSRMPKGLALPELLALAGEEFTHNATLNQNRSMVEDPEGQHVLMVDPDMGPS